MSTFRRTTLETAVTLITVSGAFLLAPAAATAVRTSGPAAVERQDVCTAAPRYLPRTPDAVEAWLADCP